MSDPRITRDKFTPAARWGLGFALVALVATAGWWAVLQDSRKDVIRGDRVAGAFEVSAGPGAGALELAWPAVPEADAYRLVFFGPDRAEISRLEAGAVTRWTLRPIELTAPLTSGAEVSVEVEALKGGLTIATTPPRSIRLP